ncbi:hypothetical protein [Streptomyces sp. NPDC055055]
MSDHDGLHALTAAALTAAAVLVRRRVYRAARGARDAGAEGPPWRRAVSPPNAETAPDRVAELHASFAEPPLREAEAHGEPCGNRRESAYPRHEGDHRDDREADR